VDRAGTIMVGVPPRTFPLLPDEVFGRLPPIPHFEHAACRAPGVDPEWFFPGRGGSVERAKRICQNCPDLERCRRWAFTLPDWQSGVIAGMSQHERRLARWSSNGSENESEGQSTMTTIDTEFPADLEPFDEMDYEAEQEYRRWARARFSPAAVEVKVGEERLRRAEAAKWQAEHDEAMNQDISRMFGCAICGAVAVGHGICDSCRPVVARIRAERLSDEVVAGLGRSRSELVEAYLDRVT
jgi:hypothetical protein